jgi:hypothetical protein
VILFYVSSWRSRLFPTKVLNFLVMKGIVIQSCNRVTKTYVGRSTQMYEFKLKKFLDKIGALSNKRHHEKIKFLT